jgi:hypothetical protein
MVRRKKTMKENIQMRKRIVKMLCRVCGLLALAGILAVSAAAGSGPSPDPNGPDQSLAR